MCLYHCALTWLPCFWLNSQPNSGLSSTHHRRVACNFRDQSLFQVFQISLTSLRQLKNDGTALFFKHTCVCVHTHKYTERVFLHTYTHMYGYICNLCWLHLLRGTCTQICHLQLWIDCKSWLFLFHLNAYPLILSAPQLMKVPKSLALFRYLPLLVTVIICLANYQ